MSAGVGSAGVGDAGVPDRVVRTPDGVRRPTGWWSPAVHALLAHLAEVRFPGSPRLLGVGGGWETLTWLPGRAGPDGWARIVPESGLAAYARFLRAYHDAVASYRPPPDSVWAVATGGVGPGELVCHGDPGPWNVAWDDDGRPVGLFDWDMAHPGDRVEDVLYALEYAAPFRPDAEALRWLRYDAPPDRVRRIAVFLDAYGMARPDRLAARVAARQRATLAAVLALGARGLHPQAAWLTDGTLEVQREWISWTEANVDLVGG